MAKVFSITQGLENLGAMKTGGQGSVYKGRRMGPVISAIKILPTPIFSESNDDKNYTSFQNEVQKLRLVNTQLHPNVVNILSWGVTDSGNFPFIEMEFVDGPDLEELLKPPHEKIFTVSEVIKVAEQLSSALAHCHQKDVKHGDIKSNNVKYNQRTGNYVLLDFGLAALSHEQRRTSLRQAGAIEFMAPEQYEGELYFETDVYSYGVVLYELIAGTVPFALNDKTESARNQVRLAHMEAPVPDMLRLRQQAVDQTNWSADIKHAEKQVPGWLIQLVYKCLQKKPAQRFANGSVLQQHIRENRLQLPIASAAVADNSGDSRHTEVLNQNKWLLQQKEKLENEVQQYRQLVETKESDLDELKSVLARKDEELMHWQRRQKSTPAKLSTGMLVILLIVFAAGAFAAYKYLSAKVSPSETSTNSQPSTSRSTSTTANDTTPTTQNDNSGKTNKTSRKPAVKKDTAKRFAGNDKPVVPPVNTPETNEQKEPEQEIEKPQTEPQSAPRQKSVSLYSVNDKAYFYNEPDESTRRSAFIVRANNAVLAALNERGNFIYIVYTNKDGQTSKGWLRKADLSRLTQ